MRSGDQQPFRTEDDLRAALATLERWAPSAEAVLRAVAELDVTSCVVREAKGYSRQKGYLDRYLGSEYSMAFLPKVEITVCVGDGRADEVADRITRAARTGPELEKQGGVVEAVLRLVQAWRR